MAMRDANSAPLQRLQIVKGWADAGGKAFEKVFDVACSDAGKVDAKTHRCPENGATVDVKTCAYSQDKGAAELTAGWSDPEFDPTQHAFYYTRVIENPTCRWSTWDAIRAGVEPSPHLQKTIQERGLPAHLMDNAMRYASNKLNTSGRDGLTWLQNCALSFPNGPCTI